MTSQNYESYVPVYDAIPEEWDDAKPFLVEQFKTLANAVNVREIGFFLEEELLSGKSLSPPAGISGQSDQFRSIFRKVVNFGALPNAAAKTVAHGITFDTNFTLVALWAAATDPVGFVALPIPYATETANGDIELNIDATNITITTSIDYSAYTRCLVTIEYSKEL